MNLRKAMCLLKRPSHWRALIHGVAASVEHEHLAHCCPGIETVIDIGANRGQFSLIARRCFPGAKIFAFEPLPGPAAIYRRVHSRDVQVELQEMAIGPNSGTSVMHLSQRDDSSSVLPIGVRQNEIFPGTHEVGTLKVQIRSLNEVLDGDGLRTPALLKLDVQGFELQALQGCETLLPLFDHVYLELSFVELYSGQILADEVLQYLGVRGYKLCGVYNMAYDQLGRAVQADFYLARPTMP